MNNVLPSIWKSPEHCTIFTATFLPSLKKTLLMYIASRRGDTRPGAYFSFTPGEDLSMILSCNHQFFFNPD